LRDSRGVNGFSASNGRPDVVPAPFSHRRRPSPVPKPAFDRHPPFQSHRAAVLACRLPVRRPLLGLAWYRRATRSRPNR